MSAVRTTTVRSRVLIAGALAAALVSGAAGATAHAEEPTGPTPGVAAAAAGPVDASQPDPTPAAVVEALPDDGVQTVVAVVDTPDGPEVVTEEAADADVAAVSAELEARAGVVDVFVDSPLWALEVDPRRAEQWSFPAMGLDQAQVDAPTAATGAGIQVAVVDSGVRSAHPDFRDSSGVSRVRCDLGADFASDAATVDPAGTGCVDPDGHGTHVAGQIAAVSDNGIGISGLSAAEIIPVRVLNAQGWGMESDVVRGIRHAVDVGADIINLSLGGGTEAAAFTDVVAYARANGVLLVASAGNSRQQGNPVNYPAHVPGVMAVAATDRDDLSAPFSTSHPANFISAPGVEILSTSIDGSYAEASGTSMAAPNVAGVLARYRAAHPTATVADVEAAVQATAIDLEGPGRDANTGHGLIDGYQLLTGIESPARTPTTTPTAPTLAIPVAGNASATLRWSAPAYDGGSPIIRYQIGVYELTFSGGSEFWRGIRLEEALSTARSRVVSGLTNGRLYAFAMRATTDRGAGQWAESDVVMPASVPGAPRLGTVTPGNRTLRVTWSAAAPNGYPVEGYYVSVYRGTTRLGIVPASASARALTVTGLTNGTAYTVLVQARNELGYSRPSARSAAVAPRTVPTAPRIGTPSAGRSSVLVRWAAPSSNGGAPIDRYMVQTFRGTTLVRSTAMSASARQATITALTPGVAYNFRVLARNAAGWSPASARSVAVRPLR